MPTHSIDYKKDDPANIKKKQQEWADYVRKRMRPDKTCSKCKKTFPNDREHFATNLDGRILNTCIYCAPSKIKGKLRLKEICPCCESTEHLVHDRQAPAPVSLCRPCLNTINTLACINKLTAERMAEYIEWRKRGQLAVLNITPAGAEAPPRPDPTPDP